MTIEAQVQYLNGLVRELQKDQFRLLAENARLRQQLARGRLPQPQRLSEILEAACQGTRKPS
jgi:ribosomal protein L29